MSSKEQEREGFSIPAQLELLRNYAKTQGMSILREFVDIESASVSGRTGFGEMLRLYRNIRNYVAVDEYGVTIHLRRKWNRSAQD